MRAAATAAAVKETGATAAAEKAAETEEAVTEAAEREEAREVAAKEAVRVMEEMAAGMEEVARAAVTEAEVEAKAPGTPAMSYPRH